MTHNVTTAAAIGGGVIGGGWIARFLLNGIDVNVYDPHPEAERIVGEVLANAQRAYGKMLLAPQGNTGRLTFCATLEEAVRDADYIQESVPERLDLKQKVYRELARFCKADALIGSSTSGFKPSELQDGLANAGQVFVAHPFNPVYLLPVVEIVPTAVNSEQTVARAMAFLSEMGMKPLRVRKEIDAHIADRLLEAVWREGLWLIKDGICSTQELDDCITYGFGLRWAQMGLFETYRVAGGEAGMKHFINQFGPALKWPWTKLMDVPELTEELVDTISSQSDAQSGHHSIRELERIRDDNLVGILMALKANNWGAGKVVAEMDQRMYERARVQNGAAEVDLRKALTLHKARVLGDWVDYNGHMTEFRYLQVFGDATDAFLGFIGMDDSYLATGHSVYTVETHIRHLLEVSAGEDLRVETRLLGHDEKRIRIVHEIWGGPQDACLATAEQMLLHVDTKAGRACPTGAALADKLSTIASHHDGLEKPDYAGASVRDI
ncbi:carnitine 3-dehydrogenase [Candidatus Halocynthiibacter alkanivorans]|uniref:carnitine 3-dehydrogenase n=1 Tax=Candidatus Halocynthiibacter alkanivorans TaxID=2267619 RepID=UPI000DF370AB|nr:carnitine 3-dehydrogenase [Candidatus Halocynthiibacter alkanivorans]